MKRISGSQWPRNAKDCSMRIWCRRCLSRLLTGKIISSSNFQKSGSTLIMNEHDLICCYQIFDQKTILLFYFHLFSLFILLCLHFFPDFSYLDLPNTLHLNPSIIPIKSIVHQIPDFPECPLSVSRQANILFIQIHPGKIAYKAVA